MPLRQEPAFLGSVSFTLHPHLITLVPLTQRAMRFAFLAFHRALGEAPFLSWFIQIAADTFFVVRAATQGDD
jgi:hypothetical protein